ncbi:autoinducer 2 ABC transporter substrate-binding protein [Aureimonas fodinaquatilis]|uniref:Autoinducer 2 ABC transporter substrate-binding protein n=1 Tax=Aureimonas fodinaquatilis TaxID=2565783 RepID=A0A5B0DZM8_9HYPH|nr:autoinducer 2 ABC transporter substrate-binding protein [Aureimonas fodinaquatilis]KAA0971896.1 autoinducer 2 ABC transporter substrate-binding protein [Aureimonas fodinaquatilis]
MRNHIRKLRTLLVTGVAMATCLAVLPAQAQEEKTFAVVVKVAGDPWWSRLEEGLVEFAAENPGIRVFMQGVSQADAALQAQLIEDLVAQNVDALGIVPISPQTLEPVIAKAREKGIVVVTHEGETQPTKDYDIEAFDNAAYGVHLMDQLAAGMGEEGEYAVFVGRLTNVSQNIWVDAAIAHQKEKYPNMTLVGDRNETGEDAATAYRKTLELLAAYPNIKGFQGSSSNDPIGIGQAVEEAGLEERTTVVSTSLVSLTRDLLETGAVDVISFWDPKLAGQAMMVAALRKINNEPIETGDDLGIVGYESVTVVDDVVYGAAWVDVTAENMDEYDF